MNNSESLHIIPYSTYFVVLLALLAMTGLSVAVTQIELGTFTVTTALVLASLKSLLVLIIFMHLKFDKKIYAFMVAGIFLLITTVMIITFLDYLYR